MNPQAKQGDLNLWLLTVFSVTNGRKKPSKHLKLRLAVTCMAWSKTLIGMLNRYGHCVSYTKTDELETELTFSVTSVSKISPPDLVPTLH